MVSNWRLDAPDTFILNSLLRTCIARWIRLEGQTKGSTVSSAPEKEMEARSFLTCVSNGVPLVTLNS